MANALDGGALRLGGPRGANHLGNLRTANQIPYAVNGGLATNDRYLMDTCSTSGGIYYCNPTISYDFASAAQMVMGVNPDCYNQATGGYCPGPEPQAGLELQQRRVGVTSRAEALLLSGLSLEQAESLRKYQYFLVSSKDGKRLYRISYGIAGNIHLIEKGRPVAQYCIHPVGVPTEDVMLAQKLMLETDEESFLRIANRTSLRGSNGVVLAA